jgi:hypothetical protein
MRTKSFNLWMILLFFGICIFSVSCGQGEEDAYISPKIPIGERIDSAIKEAQDTYKKIGEFRDFIFEHALEQSRWIIASSYRKLPHQKTKV